MAHGAAVCLRGRDEALRVFVTASPETRVRRVMEQGELPERAAQKAINASDRARREYLWRFYAVRQESPTHYDLTLNTDALTPAATAAIMIGAAAN